MCDNVLDFELKKEIYKLYLITDVKRLSSK